MPKKTGTSSKSPSSPGGGPTYLPLLGAVVAVENLEEASAFYQKLGFVQEMSLDGTDGRLIHVTLRFGSNVFMLGRLDASHYEYRARTRLIQEGPRGLGVTFLIVVPDLKAVYEVVRAAGLKVLLEPRDEFYGDRVFLFVDPYGYE